MNLRRHRRATLQVYRNAKNRIRKTRAVQVGLRSRRSSLEGAYSIWQRGDDVSRAAKETEGVVETKGRNAVFPLCVADWERAIEINTAVVEGVSQGDGVEVKRSDEIGAWRKILGAEHMQRTQYQRYC